MADYKWKVKILDGLKSLFGPDMEKNPKIQDSIDDETPKIGQGGEIIREPHDPSEKPEMQPEDKEEKKQKLRKMMGY